jgi:hypothetical protein
VVQLKDTVQKASSREVERNQILAALEAGICNEE